MKFLILEIFTFFAVNIYFGFALSRQNEVHEDTFHSCDFLKLMKKLTKHTNTCESINLLSDGDISSVIKFDTFLPVSINSALLDLLSEAPLNKCVEDLNYVQESLLSPDGWAIKMLDSYGKPESGILEGNLKWLGHYDECVSIQAPTKENSDAGGFRGKYCTLQAPLKFGPVSKAISIAVCLPDSCNLNKIGFNLLRKDHLKGSFLNEGKIKESTFCNMTLTCKTTSRKLTTGAIVVICLLCVFALLALTGSFITAFEYFKKEKFFKDHNWKPFFNCFCILTNGEKILNTDNSERQLPFLHGIRVLSMNWILLLHTYSSQIPMMGNTYEVIKNSSRWSLVLNSFFAVDSFFVLSGFLVGYSFFQKAEKTDGNTSWLYFYTHRYVRLTPVYMIVLAFYATVYPLLGSGPFWPDYKVIRTCTDYWWWNMLFINNLQSKFHDLCMNWSWYLANDIQFYTISPLFLITLRRWPKIGYSLLGLFFCISFVSNFVLTYESYIPGLEPNNVTLTVTDMIYRMPGYLDIIYTRPYTRVGPYLVGLLLAHYVYRRKCRNSSSLKFVTLSVGWVVACGILLACKFGYFQQDLTTVEASLYNAFSRTVFAVGLGWVIFVCVIKQGGVVNSILSWKVLIPLSRLTYCVYLVHPIFLRMYFNSMRASIIYNTFNLVMLYFAFLVMCYAVALVTYLLLESPLIRLETLIRNILAPHKVYYVK